MKSRARHVAVRLFLNKAGPCFTALRCRQCVVSQLNVPANRLKINSTDCQRQFHLNTTSGVFDADVRTLTDYHPFGMQMPERTWAASGVAGHRYGFNGKENDNEVKGEGNQQDYGFRIYDPRVARFLTVDPLAGQYAELTPYQFASNTPIWAIDLDGLEARVYTETTATGHTFLTLGTGKDLVVFSYGRFAGSDWYTAGTTGPGVLMRYTGQDARRYIANELYNVGARAFEIKDANETSLRKMFENAWSRGQPPTEAENVGVKEHGRVINNYDIVTMNCTSIVCGALKLSGSAVFDEHALWGLYAYDEDFVIPSSLQSYLESKAKSTALVGEVTAGVKEGISLGERSSKPDGSSSTSRSSSGLGGESSGSSANSEPVGPSSSGNNSGSSSADVDRP